MTRFLSLCLGLFLASSTTLAYDAPHAATAPNIDGVADDDAWGRAEWANIDQLILGTAPSADDFRGHFKMVWTAEKLYLLARITDDVLIDSHSDPLDSYWEDDTLELFLDEDQSGGNHLNNHDAMAYHIALDNQVVDIGVDGQPRLFNSHVKSQWRRTSNSPNSLIWEASFSVYPKTLSDDEDGMGKDPVLPVVLHVNKKIGFLVAYCDADGDQGREHFLSSIDVAAVNGDKNRAYITADVFDELVLME